MPRWSQLIAPSLSALAAGCGAATVSEREPPSAQPAASAAASTTASVSAPVTSAPPSPWLFRIEKKSPPPAPREGAPSQQLSALSPVFAASGADKTVKTERLVVRGALFNVVETRLSDCPIDNRGCGVFQVARGDALGPEHPLHEAWDFVASGVAHVYGFRKGQPMSMVEGTSAGDFASIDRIDADGNVTPLGRIDVARAIDVSVIELATGAVAIATHREGFRIFELAREASRARLPVATTLPYRLGEAPLQLGEAGTAQSARYARQGRGRAAWGPLVTTPLLDGDGKRTRAWALALVEIIPPPVRKPGEIGDRNGCGSLSRSLADRTVEKVVRVLRFDGTKLVTDRVIQRTKDRDVTATPLTLEARASGGLLLDGVELDAGDKPVSGAAKAAARSDAGPARLPTQLATGELRLPSDGEIGPIAWSAARQEGLARVALREGTFVVTFDADAHVVGPAIETRAARVHAFAGEWLAEEASPPALTWLTGPRKGERTPLPAATEHALSHGDALYLWWGAPGAPGGRLRVAAFSTSGALGAATDVEPIAAESVVVPFAVGGKPGLVVSASDTARFVPVAGATTTLVAPLAGAGDTRAQTVSLRPVWNDVAMLIVQQRREMTMSVGPRMVADPREMHRGVWLGSGKETRFALSHDLEGELAVPHGIPDTPGAPFESDAFVEAMAAGCRAPVPVGPRRAIVACNGGVDPVKPGFGGGLRVLTY